jgi:integrase
VLLVKRMGYPVTTHGFRSSFSTWTAERTAFAPEVREAALAHATRDKTAAAYQRGQLLQKRRQLMDAWSKFCSSPPVKSDHKVVALRS